MVKRPPTTGRCSRTTDPIRREIPVAKPSLRWATQSRARIRPKNPHKGRKIPYRDAENLDWPTKKGSNHPTMDGFHPFLPLNPHHPTQTGDSWAGGLKSDFLSVNHDFETTSLYILPNAFFGSPN